MVDSRIPPRGQILMQSHYMTHATYAATSLLQFFWFTMLHQYNQTNKQNQKTKQTTHLSTL